MSNWATPASLYKTYMYTLEFHSFTIVHNADDNTHTLILNTTCGVFQNKFLTMEQLWHDLHRIVAYSKKPITISLKRG